MSALNVAWVGTQTVGNQTAKQLLQFLAYQNFGDSRSLFSNQYLATHLEVKIRAVQNATKLLIERKFIIIKRRFDKKTGRQTSNEIILNIPEDFKEDFLRRYSPDKNMSPYKTSGSGPHAPKTPSPVDKSGLGCSKDTLPLSVEHPPHALGTSPKAKKETFPKVQSTTYEETQIPNNNLNNNINKRERALSIFSPNDESKALCSDLKLNINDELNSFENRHRGFKTQYEFQRWLRNSKSYIDKNLNVNRNETRSNVPFWGPGHPSYDAIHC